MRGAVSSKLPSSAPLTDTLLIGRSFVLGLPDRQGQFRIFLNGAVWRIAVGDYQAGDRVQVTGVEADVLVVQCVGALSGSRS